MFFVGLLYVQIKPREKKPHKSYLKVEVDGLVAFASYSRKSFAMLSKEWYYFCSESPCPDDKQILLEPIPQEQVRRLYVQASNSRCQEGPGELPRPRPCPRNIGHLLFVCCVGVEDLGQNRVTLAILGSIEPTPDVVD